MPTQTLEEYLASLEAQRATITLQIAGARMALGMPPEDGVAVTAAAVPAGAPGLRTGAVTGRIRSDEFFRMSIPEAIKAYLEIMKKPQMPKAIADGLKAGGVLSESSNFYANVLTAIKRLRASSQLVNTKTGGWGMARWYEGRSGAVAAEMPKKGKKRRAKKHKKPKTGGTAKHATAYNAFVSEQRKAGKSLAEAAAEWRKKKGGNQT
jgi:hypothetical protein